LSSGRPSAREGTVDERVGDRLVTDVAVVRIEADIAQARHELERQGGDRVMVIGSEGVVLGVAGSSALECAGASTTVADVITLGPPTIRPDEKSSDVEERMRPSGVTHLTVTTPTGRLLGVFVDNGAAD
jgi:predicted transcriptional regulator